MSTLPTFSPGGWVQNPLEQVDHLVAYFFTTQKSQSHFHKNAVTSYQYLIADAKSTPELKSSIEMKLGDHLKSQFTNVNLTVSIDGAFDDPDNNELTISISCTFDIDGRRYSIDHAIEALGTEVKKIYRINETGRA